MSGTVGYIDNEPEPEEGDMIGYDGDGEEGGLTFMQESLFTVPDSYDDEVLEEVAAFYDDPDVVYVAGDIEDDVVLSEDETVAIMANYSNYSNYDNYGKLLQL